MTLTCTAMREAKLLEILRRELGLSSSLVARLKRERALLVGGVPARTDCLVHVGDRVEVLLREPPPAFPPEPGKLRILYEDEALLAVDKAAGVWVHPTPSRQRKTLANRVAWYYAETDQPCGVHLATRLDRDTFGVVLLAKNAYVHAALCRQQRAGGLHKLYLAAVAGRPERDEGRIDLPIARRETGLLREVRPDGQEARTTYRLLAHDDGISLLALRPETGRTHQLRVHCAALGCPILGDRDYGTEVSQRRSLALGVGTQQLEAAALSLRHPLTGAPLWITSRQRPFFSPAKFLEFGG